MVSERGAQELRRTQTGRDHSEIQPRRNHHWNLFFGIEGAPAIYARVILLRGRAEREPALTSSTSWSIYARVIFYFLLDAPLYSAKARSEIFFLQHASTFSKGAMKDLVWSLTFFILKIRGKVSIYMRGKYFTAYFFYAHIYMSNYNFPFMNMFWRC